MVTAEKTEDMELVRQTITDRRVYKWISDDYSPQPHMVTEEQLKAGASTYIQVRDGQQHLGVFALHAHNGACVEIHTCLLPVAWGERAKEAAVAMREWVWNHTGFHRIITNVPTYNRLALQFAVTAGMEQFGINYSSFMKDGKLHDQILLGISRPKEFECR